MLINPHPYGKGRHCPLNNRPWPNMLQGSALRNLVDADMLVYAAGFAIEHCEYYVYGPAGNVVFRCDGKDKFNRWKKTQKPEDLDKYSYDEAEWVEPFDKTRVIIDLRAKAICQASHTQKMWWYLTKGSTLWRNDDAHIQEYKGNRKEMRKPQAYDFIRDYMAERYRAKTLFGLEADDGVAALARENPGKVIVTSGDKDLKTIPGLHLSPTKPHIYDGVIFISELEACRNLYIQMLTGDRIDNIKGLSGDKQHPGWGPVKARKAIEQFICEGDMAEFVANQYRLTYPSGVIGYGGEHLTWQEMLVETANLLFLRRYHETQFTWES